MKHYKVNHTFADDPDKPASLTNLGNVHETLFEYGGPLEHIRMAIECQTQAVALTPDGHPLKPNYLSNLGVAYRTVFRDLGDVEHIRMAIRCLTQAVELTPNDHPNKAHHLSNLGDAYNILFDCLGHLEHVCITINCKTQALALTPEGNPIGARHLANLGRLYRILFTSSGEFEYLAKSKQYSRCAALSPAGYPIDKLLGAGRWGWLSICQQTLLAGFSDISPVHRDGCDALEAYSHCMLRLPEAIWLGTSVRRRFEQCLAPYTQNIASNAVVAAIMANRCDLAVEWLEQGRCLVWGQMLQLRTPFDELHAAHPDLANELYRLSSRLEDTGSNMHEELPRSNTYMHSQLADRRSKLIDEIRLKPGFDDFLRPPKASIIVSHAHHGITVALNANMLRCDAIIIEPDTNHAITHIPLPGFSQQKAEQLRQHLVLYLKSQGATRGIKKADRSVRTCFEGLLATLWSDVVKPVLDHLNITRILPIDDLPHITWCITGPLSFLPVHAAGIYDNPNTVLSNLAISSYTPTLTSMSRSRSTPLTFSGILAVGHQSSVRGLSPLPGTKDELDMVEKQFTDRRFTRLEENTATIDAVVKAMGDHSWVHFACHGSQDPLDPMNSALHLHDKDLSLSMISKHSMKNAQLAFLSACQTATGDSELPDEAVHLAAGLLMAGYENVIATMWSIKDQDAPTVAGETYKYMLKGGVPDSTKAAKALHRAVKHLQDAIGVNEFARWVPYIHMGG
ncbi:hypothetical protein FRC12_005833 [Ceratobasidium sp. 428]|nr:hypothetical protein FRC12_005833 [Ceratobasidium sp. 428]